MPYERLREMFGRERRPWNRRYPVWRRIRDEIILEVGLGAAFRLFRMYGEWSMVASVLRHSGRLNQRHSDDVPVTPQRVIRTEHVTPPDSSRKKQKMTDMEGVMQAGTYFKTGNKTNVEESFKGEILRKQYTIHSTHKHSTRHKHEPVHQLKIAGQLFDDRTRDDGTNTGSGIIGCQEGQQAFVFEAVMTRPYIDSNAAVGTPNTSFPDHGLFALQTDQATTGSTLNNPVATPYMDMIKLWSHKRKYHLSNLNGFPIFVEICVVKALKNTPSDVSACWSDAIKMESNASYNPASASGNTSGSALNLTAGYPVLVQRNLTGGPGPQESTGGYPSVNTLGERPYGYRNFRKIFKVEKTIKVDLAPGANFLLELIFRYHGKLLRREYIADCPYTISNMSYYVMWFFHGALGVDTGTKGIGPAPGVHNVSTMPCNLYGIVETVSTISPVEKKDTQDTKWTVQRIETGAVVTGMTAGISTDIPSTAGAPPT